MNVLMYGWELPPQNSGGLGTACYGLTQALSRHHVNINFVLPRPLPHHLNFMKVHHSTTGQGDLASCTAVNSLITAYSTSNYYEQLLKQVREKDIKISFAPGLIAESIRYGQNAGKLAKKVPHDVIHSHDWLTFPAGMAAARRSGKPFVAHVHATEFDRCASDHVNHQVAEIEYQGLKHADHIIAVSQYTKNLVAKKYAINPDKISVVHNGVETKEFPLSFLKKLLPGYQIVLFVGRLTIQKGPDYFIKAAKKVLAIKPKTIFILAGDGDMKEQLIFQAASQGIGHRVLFPGFIRDRAQLGHLYQAADVFVMPSVSEPFGIVPLEALANQKPVIISRQSGVAEVISHALKVDFWDIDRLAETIIACLQYPELRSEMAANGYRQVQHLTWDNAANKTIAIYQQLISS